MFLWDNIVIILMFTGCLYFLFRYVANKDKKRGNKSDNERKYILNVITKHSDGGYSSHWHGWSNKWLFTHEEAVKEKAKIQDLFYDVEIEEILPHSNEEVIKKDS